MRILFVGAKLHTIEPFGMMSLSPPLKRDGHAVRLVEAESPDLVDRLRGYRPHVVGYSVCTGSDPYYLALNRYLKKHHRFVAVFGGPHPTFFPEMIREAGVDAICRGEGDLAFPHFCRELERSGFPRAVPNFTVRAGSRIESRPPRPLVRDLDALPFPDRALYYTVSPEIAGHRIRSFLASRGCAYACTYCFNPAMDALYDGAWRRVRLRSPAHLAEEIASVAGAFPTEFVAFRESIFPLKRDWLADFAEVYRRRVGLPFYCHVRLDLLTPENVSLLARAGCHSVNVGIEAGSEAVRRALLRRRMRNGQMVAACALLRRHGIRILANSMLGLPGCSFRHDMETLRLNQACRPDYALAMLWQPYPGTALGRFARERGHYRGDFRDLDFTYYRRSPLTFGNSMEKRRVENLQKLFAVAAAVPALTPLVGLLTRLPPNRIFRAIFRTCYLLFHQTEIFPHRTSASDWIRNLRHIAKGA
jgi:radical SAM superfamily enzyme YgiQ (UPF0313 family)